MKEELYNLNISRTKKVNTDGEGISPSVHILAVEREIVLLEEESEKIIKEKKVELSNKRVEKEKCLDDIVNEIPDILNNLNYYEGAIEESKKKLVQERINEKINFLQMYVKLNEEMLNNYNAEFNIKKNSFII
jgi:hypothetical protein